jgi:hypothetical protein
MSSTCRVAAKRAVTFESHDEPTRPAVQCDRFRALLYRLRPLARVEVLTAAHRPTASRRCPHRYTVNLGFDSRHVLMGSWFLAKAVPPIRRANPIWMPFPEISFHSGVTAAS